MEAVGCGPDMAGMGREVGCVASRELVSEMADIARAGEGFRIADVEGVLRIDLVVALDCIDHIDLGYYVVVGLGCIGCIGLARSFRNSRLRTC